MPSRLLLRALVSSRLVSANDIYDVLQSRATRREGYRQPPSNLYLAALIQASPSPAPPRLARQKLTRGYGVHVHRSRQVLRACGRAKGEGGGRCFAPRAKAVVGLVVGKTGWDGPFSCAACLLACCLLYPSFCFFAARSSCEGTVLRTCRAVLCCAVLVPAGPCNC